MPILNTLSAGYPPNQRHAPNRSGQLATTQQVRVPSGLPTPTGVDRWTDITSTEQSRETISKCPDAVSRRQTALYQKITGSLIRQPINCRIDAEERNQKL